MKKELYDLLFNVLEKAKDLGFAPDVMITIQMMQLVLIGFDKTGQIQPFQDLNVDAVEAKAEWITDCTTLDPDEVHAVSMIQGVIVDGMVDVGPGVIAEQKGQLALEMKRIFVFWYWSSADP